MTRAIIVEDEKRSSDELAHLVNKYCQNIEIVSVAQTVRGAIECVNEKKPDLAFLDIELPDGTGFQVLQRLPKVQFGVIFTTAYEHYAIKAIKACALDYLLKPLDIDELIQAVNKVKDEFKLAEFQKRKEAFYYNNRIGDSPKRKIGLATLEGMVFVFEDEIVYCQANNNYTNFFLVNNKKLMVCKPLSYFEDILDEALFCRSHQSYLVNISYVQKYIKGRGGQLIMLNGAQIEVSERMKGRLLERFTK